MLGLRLFLGFLLVGLALITGNANAVPVATNLDGSFSLSANANIFFDTTVPHATVQGELLDVNQVDWYSFTGQAGATFFADHDGGGAVGTVALLDSQLFLFLSSGELVAHDDDSCPEDPGSADCVNSFLGTFVLPANDTYYLALTAFNTDPISTGCVRSDLTRPDGEEGGRSDSGCTDRSFAFNDQGEDTGSYTLHISVSSTAAVPEPGSLALVALALAGVACARRRLG